MSRTTFIDRDPERVGIDITGSSAVNPPSRISRASLNVRDVARMPKLTFSLDEATVRTLRQAAERSRKPRA